MGDQTSSQARTCGIDATVLCLFEIGLHGIHYSCLTKALNTGRKPRVWQCGAEESVSEQSYRAESGEETRVVFQQHVPQAEYRS